MAETAKEPFEVTGWVHRLGGFIAGRRDLWVRLAGLETRLLRDRLDDLRIDRPVYISGLARAGTTILLEIVARHPDVVTHQYRDYPPVYTPYWWNWLLGYMETRPAQPIERAHADGILITPASPEAMEEILWMTFFPDCHALGVNSVLDGTASNPAFEAFYREHVGKLLLARGGRRYVSKGNYNITRLQYLQRLFPDARFVLPVRDPAGHVASLIKQQRLFSQATRESPRAREHLRRVGHFEFGPDRVPIDADDAARVREIAALWAAGEEVRGWARYWSHIYGFVADRLAADTRLVDAACVVRFEDLCRSPGETLERVFAHAGLADAGSLIDAAARELRFPAYYTPAFTESERAIIAEETAATAARFGYAPP